jgi:hypothetical protein
MTGQPDSGGQDSPGRERCDRQAPPGADILTDIQRWLIRSGAKSVRKEFGGQVRKTFGGARPNAADVWDTATSEPPPESGEAPECQWCPICRAARRMRESGPGLSGQLAGAGDAVAAAVQEAVRAFDSLLSRAGSYEGQRPGPGPAEPGRSGHGPAEPGRSGHGPAEPGASGPGPGEAGADDGQGHGPSDRS